MRIGVTGPVTDFEYVPGPFRQEVYDIDWVPLTTLETTSAHVRIHELKEEDSLSFFMSAVASSAGLAVIFINSENTFRCALLSLLLLFGQAEQAHLVIQLLGLLASEASLPSHTAGVRFPYVSDDAFWPRGLPTRYTQP